MIERVRREADRLYLRFGIAIPGDDDVEMVQDLGLVERGGCGWLVLRADACRPDCEEKYNRKQWSNRANAKVQGRSKSHCPNFRLLCCADLREFE